LPTVYDTTYRCEKHEVLVVNWLIIVAVIIQGNLFSRVKPTAEPGHLTDLHHDQGVPVGSPCYFRESCLFPAQSLDPTGTRRRCIVGRATEKPGPCDRTTFDFYRLHCRVGRAPFIDQGVSHYIICMSCHKLPQHTQHTYSIACTNNIARARGHVRAHHRPPVPAP
jgi:hypothetical protein